jgi:hypothetical protein
MTIPLSDSYYLLQGLVLGFAATCIVPPIFRTKAKGWKLRLATIFLAFSLLGLLFTAPQFSLFEATVRSMCFGAIPLVGGYLFARFVKSNAPH